MSLHRLTGCSSLYILVLLSLSMMISVLNAEECATPFSIAITNVGLQNGTSMRGLAVAVGTPQQDLAMLASMSTNNTYIYDTQGQCTSGETKDFCTTYRGGLFHSSASQTYKVAKSANASGADPLDTWAASMQSEVWCTDTFRLTENISLSTYPFGIMRSDSGGGYLTQHVMGLGPNSTILTALKSAGKIASRSWSIYWGLDGATEETQSAGTFVFGGFDSSKTSGQNYTAPLSYNNAKCASGMVVTIDGLELTYPNGSTANLFEDSESAALAACITPDFPALMTLPRIPYYNQLETFASIPDREETHSIGVNYWAETYPSEYILDFGMALSFSSGLQVQIENNQLVQPDETISSNGSINYNATLNEVNIISLQSTNQNDMVHLGRQFLSGTYLMVNEDAGTFTMWQAVPNKEEMLVAVDTKGDTISSACTVAGNMVNVNGTASLNTTTSLNNTASSNSTTSLVSSPTLNHSQGLETGAIAGIVVGGVAIIAIIAIFSVCVRKRRASKLSRRPGAPIFFWDEKPPAPPYSTHLKHLDDISGPQELGSSPKFGAWIRQEMEGDDGRRTDTRKRGTLPGVFELGN